MKTLLIVAFLTASPNAPYKLSVSVASVVATTAVDGVCINTRPMRSSERPLDYYRSLYVGNDPNINYRAPLDLDCLAKNIDSMSNDDVVVRYEQYVRRAVSAIHSGISPAIAVEISAVDLRLAEAESFPDLLLLAARLELGRGNVNCSIQHALVASKLGLADARRFFNLNLGLLRLQKDDGSCATTPHGGVPK